MAYKPGDVCQTCKQVICKCMTCYKCKKRVPKRDVCDKCSYCKEHHDGCYPKDFPHRPCSYLDQREQGNTYIINPCHRTIGVELEMGHFGSVRDQYSNGHIAWDLVRDGSVQESGLELVTQKMAGDRYIYGLSRLAYDLNSSGAYVNKSCGYHVHVDAAELAPFDLRRILVAFFLVQNDLYGTLVDESRLGDWGRQYCAPLKCDPAQLMAMDDKAQFVDWMHNWLYGVKMPTKSQFADDDATYRAVLRDIDTQLKNFKNTKYVNRARRWALNFHSWMMRGTLEFRLKEGTTGTEDLLLWPLWCMWFVDKIGAASDKEAHYWLKKGAGVLSISEFMADGPGGMPDYVLEWVRRKVAK